MERVVEALRAPVAWKRPCHPQTSALALEPAAPLHYRAQTDPRYWNQIGPFGGWLAGLAMAALGREAGPEWTVRSIGLQFLGRLPAGPIDIHVAWLRRQRRVAALRAELRAAGQTDLAVTADAVFGLATAPSAAPPGSARPVPALPDPLSLPRLDRLDPLAAFARRFDIRVAYGEPLARRRDEVAPRAGGWLRARDALPPGPETLLMLNDAWYPTGWAALAEPVPVSTVTLQVVFHDAAPGPGPVDGFHAACYEASAEGAGFGLERSLLWWPDGRLALSAQQLTWIGAAGPAQRVARPEADHQERS